MVRVSFLNSFLFTAMLTAILLLTACQPEVKPSSTIIPTALKTSLPSQPSAATAGQIPAIQAETEVTSSSPTLPCQVMEVVQFQPGGTSFMTSGVITPAEKHCFTLQAGVNQLLTASTSAEMNSVLVEVFTRDGLTAVPPQSMSASQWVGLLPATQEYLVSVTTTGITAEYFLSIELPANLTLEPPNNSLLIDGMMTVNPAFHPNIFTRVRYRLYLPAGRTLSVNLLSPDPSDLSLGLYGELDGQPYKRYEILGNVLSLEIPVSQNYFIDVYGISGKDSPFTLQLNITG